MINLNTRFAILKFINTPSKPSPCVGIRTCSDYSPFGVELDGRTVSVGYRFGYQGSEKDNEFKGNGNSYTTEFRQLDPRLGRWLSVDPMANEREWLTPYNFTQNNSIIRIDPSGALDDWYKDTEGNIEWKNETSKYVIDAFPNGKHKVWTNIGKQLTEETAGIGNMESVLFDIFMYNQNKWSTANGFYGTGFEVSNIQVPKIPSYYHPLQNSPGFVKDRITSNSSIFVANESINNGNFCDAMMGDFQSGQGPENFYFGPKHSLSKSMVNSEIAFNAIKKFQRINMNWRESGVKPLVWEHFSQSPTNLGWSVFGSFNEGGGRPTTVENFIGGAAISITPISVVNSNSVIVRVTIFNVTSIGSGNISNGQSFPRPIGNNLPQPYTNISQVIEFDSIITLKK